MPKPTLQDKGLGVASQSLEAGSVEKLSVGVFSLVGCGSRVGKFEQQAESEFEIP